jgi:hypothetical protein
LMFQPRMARLLLQNSYATSWLPFGTMPFLMPLSL